MTDKILTELRAVSDNLKNAILRPLVLDRAGGVVTVTVVTDSSFSLSDERAAGEVVRRYVPPYFGCKVVLSKLSPDCEMVKRKILDAVCACSKAVFATLSEGDVSVEKTDGGFRYYISVAPSVVSANLVERVNKYLCENFCGAFEGTVNVSGKTLESLEVEETRDEVEFEIPVRTFDIENFEFLEGETPRKTAIYIADLNLAGEEVVICGNIEEIRERSYTNKKGAEKTYYNFVLNDGTGTAYATYFPRVKSIEKIKGLKAGDSVVLSGVNEPFNGNMRFTAKTVDLGRVPKGFVVRKRKSKPVPVYYRAVIPQPFVDAEQTDIFHQRLVPDCMKGKTFVVFDLETTGLNSSPVSGNMDRIIEIGAFKIVDGEIAESFSTFVNPGRKLSEEITRLTGISEEMVADAPSCEEVMPDFFKFCHGSILVGHNMAGFDFKFVDYYCSTLGYILERKIIDTITLSQELLFLPNYKLNTVADKFNITFNHHRAIDDALATAKVFIELIKMKKSLPKFQ